MRDEPTKQLLRDYQDSLVEAAMLYARRSLELARRDVAKYAAEHVDELRRLDAALAALDAEAIV